MGGFTDLTEDQWLLWHSLWILLCMSSFWILRHFIRAQHHMQAGTSEAGKNKKFPSAAFICKTKEAIPKILSFWWTRSPYLDQTLAKRTWGPWELENDMERKVAGKFVVMIFFPPSGAVFSQSRTLALPPQQCFFPSSVKPWRPFQGGCQCERLLSQKLCRDVCTQMVVRTPTGERESNEGEFSVNLSIFTPLFHCLWAFLVVNWEIMVAFMVKNGPLDSQRTLMKWPSKSCVLISVLQSVFWCLAEEERI